MLNLHFMKAIYILLGSISLMLGVIGIFVPLLPTTPFLLLSAALYFRGSPYLYEWLINHKRLGTYIRNFREHRAIPLRGKVLSVGLLWTTITISAFCFVALWWVRILLFCIAIGVSIHILSFKTLK